MRDSRLVRPLSGLLAVLALALPRGAGAHAPHDNVMKAAISPTFDVDATAIVHVQESANQYVGLSTDGGRSWTHLGNPVAEKNVQAFAFSSAFSVDETVFAATWGHGVWKSVDRGATWTWIGAGLPSPSVHDVAVSPDYAVDGVVLAATVNGLGRSTDGGGSWSTATVGSPGTTLTTVAFAGDGFGTAFAAGDSLYRSSDHGQSWSVLAALPLPPVDLVVSPGFALDQTLAVSYGPAPLPQPGVSVSTDGGATFLDMNSGLTDPFVNSVSIADDGTFFAVAESTACYRADGALQAWTVFADGFEALSPQTDSHFQVVAASPAFSVDDIVVVGGHGGFFYSSDRGETWRQGEVYHQLINTALQISPTYATDGRLYVGNYGGGPYLWDETTRRWSALGTGIQHLYPVTLTVSPTFAVDQTVIFARSGVWKSLDAGESWTQIAPVAGGVVRGMRMSPAYATDQTAFMNRPDIGGTFRTTNGGTTWDLIPALANGRPAIALSPDWTNDRTMFTSVKETTAGIWRSTDGGDAWENVSGPIGAANVTEIEVSPTFAVDDVVFAGTRRNGLYRSDDRGETWVQLTAIPSGTGDKIESIAFSPDFATDETVWVVSFYDGVLRTTDGGTSWQTMNTGLPIAVKRKIALSPEFTSDGTAYVSTHRWTYRTTDGGQSWWPLSGYVRVNDVHQAIRRSGWWWWGYHVEDYGAETTRSNTAGNWEELEFFGGRITWVARRDSEAGMANVFVDGELAETIDLYSPTMLHRQEVFTRSLTNDWHVIRVEVLGKSNPASTDAWIRSDGYEYLSVLGDNSVGVTGPGPRPLRVLEQNRPNPFRPGTTIGYSLNRAGPVRLAVHDVRGGLVRVLVEEDRPAGSHRVQWDGRDAAGNPAASGVYFYEIQAGSARESRKMILLR